MPDAIGGNRRREQTLSRGDRAHLLTAIALVTGFAKRLGSARRAEMFSPGDPGKTGEQPASGNRIALRRKSFATSPAARIVKVASPLAVDGGALRRLADDLHASLMGARRASGATVLRSVTPIAFRTAGRDASAADGNLQVRRRETGPGLRRAAPATDPVQDGSRRTIAPAERQRYLTRLRSPMRPAFATIEQRAHASAVQLSRHGTRGPLDGRGLLDRTVAGSRRPRLARGIASVDLAAQLRTSLARSAPVINSSARNEFLSASRNRSAHPSLSTPIVVNFSPTVEIAGAAAADNLEQRVMAAISQHSHELMGILRKQMQSRQRAAFE